MHSEEFIQIFRFRRRTNFHFKILRFGNFFLFFYTILRIVIFDTRRTETEFESFFNFVDERIFISKFFENSWIYLDIWTDGHNFFSPLFSFDKFHVQFFSMTGKEATGKITRREDDPFLAR